MNKINNTVFAVTLKSLRENRACFEGYNKLVRSLQGKEFSEQDETRASYIRFRHDDPIPIEYILNSNGLDDALWALRCVKGADRDIRLCVVWYARQVQHLMQDERSFNALSVAERFANGNASEGELLDASAAASAASAARDAAMGAQKEMLIKMCRGDEPWQVV